MSRGLILSKFGWAREFQGRGSRQGGLELEEASLVLVAAVVLWWTLGLVWLALSIWIWEACWGEIENCEKNCVIGVDIKVNQMYAAD
jgi:hypothetical protein